MLRRPVRRRRVAASMTPLLDATPLGVVAENFPAHLLLGLCRLLGLDVSERWVTQTPLSTPLFDVFDCRGGASAAPDQRAVVLEFLVKRHKSRASREAAAVSRTCDVLGVVAGQFHVVRKNLLARIAVEIARRWKRTLRSSRRWAELASTTPTRAAGVGVCVKPGAVDTWVWRRCVFFGKSGSKGVVQHTLLNGCHYNILLTVHLLL